jgi:dihydropteroate synthase
MIDIGGESTRPGSSRVPDEDEVRRVVPVIEAIAKRFDIPLSVDTTKSTVASRAIDAGAEIINDISGLRFDPGIGRLAAKSHAGLVLMHSLGSFESMHSERAGGDLISEVAAALKEAAETATELGVTKQQIVLDPGIGFSKSREQNLELLAKLDNIIGSLDGYPLLIGTSRKSFMARGSADLPRDRVAQSVATAAIAAWNGAIIVRAHDIEATRKALDIVDLIKSQRESGALTAAKL